MPRIEYVGGPLCGLADEVADPLPRQINRPVPDAHAKNGGGTPGLPLIYIPQPSPTSGPVCWPDGSTSPMPRSRHDDRGKLVYMYEFVGFYRCGDTT